MGYGNDLSRCSAYILWVLRFLLDFGQKSKLLMSPGVDDRLRGVQKFSGDSGWTLYTQRVLIAAVWGANIGFPYK